MPDFWPLDAVVRNLILGDDFVGACWETGRLGAQLARELYGMYSGQLPPRSLFWSCTWIAFVVSAAILWVIEHRSTKALRTELDQLKLTPAKIEVTPYELQRTVSTEHRDRQARHIFLRAKVELKEPAKVSMTRYRMELSRAGVQSAPKWRKDVHAWEITNWTQTPIPHDDMPPLPDELVAGIAAEGWVHFVTTLSDPELNLSWVRFFVETTRGGGTAEIKADEHYWKSNSKSPDC